MVNGPNHLLQVLLNTVFVLSALAFADAVSV